MDFDRFQLELEWLTRGIRAIRIARFGDREAKEREMALELKGLKAKNLKARQVIDRLGKAYDKFNTDGDAHAGDVESLAGDLGSMSEDLGFMTRELGNSVANSNGSGEAKEPPAEKQVIKAADVGNVSDVLPQGQEMPLVRLGPNPSQPVQSPLTTGSPASGEPAT